MSDFVVEVDRSVPLRDALVLTAFPTIGNVSSIAVRFLVEFADLRRVGGIHSPRLPPIASVHDGRAAPLVEIFVGERACGVGGVCEELVVVTSDLPVPPELAHDLAVAILDWSREIGDGEVVALEGVKTSSDSPKAEPEIFGVASTARTRERLTENKVPLLEHGLIGGVTGVLLHRGASWGVDVYGLLVRANPDEPDARAAARLLRVVDRVLVRAGFDEEALGSAVGRIEKAVAARRRDLAETAAIPDVAYR